MPITFADFMAGKYGLSHGAIALGVIACGTVLGAVLGRSFNALRTGAVTGASGAAIASVGGYYTREMLQHQCLNPIRWNLDGQLDLGVPVMVALVSMLLVARWAHGGGNSSKAISGKGLTTL